MKLGINIDHVATLRNARGGAYPSVMRALELCSAAGADSVTIHLREDRRHIRDRDVEEIIASKILPVNLEMAATDEMQQIALKHRPFAVCLVPEKREELTTEGGLNVAAQVNKLQEYLKPLAGEGIRTSLFVDPDKAQIEASKLAGAACVEIHTGAYAEHVGAAPYLEAIQHAAKLAAGLGLGVHAGHGLNYENVGTVAAIAEIEELNIGHFLIAEALFVGLKPAILQMKELIARAQEAT